MREHCFCTGFSDAVDFSQAFSQDSLRRLSVNLVQSRFPCSARDYASFSVFASLAAGAITFGLAAVQAGLALGAAGFLLAFALALSAFLAVPALNKKRRAAAIESELAFALRSAAVELSLGAPFEKVLENLGDCGGEAGCEFSEMAREVRQGSSLPKVLSKATQRVDSDFFKRACFELSFCYEHGFKGDGLRRLADEVSSVQNAKAKEYNSRLSFLTLAFVVVACVVPALFGAYMIIGSAFLEISFTPGQIVLAYAVLFPAADSVLLAIAMASSPKVLS